MLSRTQKQLLIGGIYIFIVLVIAGGTLYGKYRPTCNDGKQNGKEEGVDCGTLACGKACEAPVQAIQVQNVQLAKTPAGDFDMAALVYNPNTNYGADRVNYDVVIRDTSSTVVSSQSYTSYISPGQTKYVVQTSLRNIPDGSTAVVVIKRVNWEKVATAPDINFLIIREAITPSVNQTTYQAVVSNQSNFDFDTMNVNVVAFDSLGTVIATNTTNFQTFLSRTERSFQVTWPFVLPAGARVSAEVNTNIFDNANFLKTNGTPTTVQQSF